MFEDSGYSRRISLLRNLISIRLEDCDSMTSYVSQLMETAQKLQGTGFEINDQWIGSLILAGLPENFEPMIMAIEHSGLNISADAIKTKLLDMSIEVKSEGAFIAKKHFNHKYGGLKKQTAHSNNSSGSRMNGNRTNPPTVNVSDGGNNCVSTKTKIIRCYKCKQIGHFKNQCPHTEKVKTNAFSVFLTKGFS